jgi:hypothetical protein
LFSDRNYRVAQRPAVFESASVLRVPIEGAKRVRCSRAGMVYFLTPLPERNRDSQSKVFLEQGFKKVALPEVPLFLPESAANYCTLYQKQCAEGDLIEFGKWAVPVFFP